MRQLLPLLLLRFLCTCGPALMKRGKGKRNKDLRLQLVLPFLLLSLQPLLAQSSPEYLELAKIAHIEQKHRAPMRDGIRLATDIYRPKTDKKVPVILSRTPYQMNGWVDGKERTRTYQRALDWVKAGYAYVVQNERGRYYSEGEWDILGTPTTDGYDAFTWLADREWSNGNIGLLGCSSVQHDPMRPRIPKSATREDLLRIQRFHDMAPEYPRVAWEDGLNTLPVQDIIKAQNGPQGIFEEMVTRTPNSKKWFEGPFLTTYGKTQRPKRCGTSSSSLSPPRYTAPTRGRRKTPLSVSGPSAMRD